MTVKEMIEKTENWGRKPAVDGSPKKEGVVSRMKTKFEKLESEGKGVEMDLVTGNDAAETTTTRKQPEAEKTKEIKDFWTKKLKGEGAKSLGREQPGMALGMKTTFGRHNNLDDLWKPGTTSGNQTYGERRKKIDMDPTNAS